jgi:hypothetical protein
MIPRIAGLNTLPGLDLFGIFLLDSLSEEFRVDGIAISAAFAVRIHETTLLAMPLAFLLSLFSRFIWIIEDRRSNWLLGGFRRIEDLALCGDEGGDDLVNDFIHEKGANVLSVVRGGCRFMPTIYCNLDRCEGRGCPRKIAHDTATAAWYPMADIRWVLVPGITFRAIPATVYAFNLIGEVE